MLLHQSDLSALSRCAAQYGYRRAGLPDKTNSAAVFGTVMHDCLHWLERERTMGRPFEECVQGAVARFLWYWNPLNIEALTDPVPPDGWLPRQGYSELRAQGAAAIQKYADLIRFDDHQLLGIEYGFRVPIDGTWDDELGEPHMLGGSVDRLAIRHYKRVQFLAVDDWKSGKEYVRLRHNLQFTAYCLDPETPVLMADLSWRSLGSIKVGDRVQGFDEQTSSGRRRWREAEVTAAWSTRKQACDLTFTDGTSLRTSDDHRWLLSDGQWVRTEDLEPGHELKFSFAPTTVDQTSEDYKAGYIAGANLGDGCFRWSPEWRSSSMGYPQSYWNVAVMDEDRPVLERLQGYLKSFGLSIPITRKVVPAHRKPMSKVETRALAHMPLLAALMEPRDSADWKAGWLAGLYDTDGSLTVGGGATIFQKDCDVLKHVVERAADLGFTLSIIERRTGGCSYARLAGDRMVRAAFTSALAPALTRKVERLEGRTVRSFSTKIVEVVRPAGEQVLCDITTSTSTFVAAGVLSHNCYATTKKEFWVGYGGEDGFGEERGTELYEQMKDWGRRGTWISLRKFEFKDAGWRGPIDYQRFALAVEQFAALVRADAYPLTISGEVCKYCDFREVCGGTGIAPEDHGKPAGVR